MEKFSQILDNVKERFANPLVFSFVLSWLVFNWEITLALFWTDTTLGSDGQNSLVGFIGSRLTGYRVFWYPLAASLAYTFGLPPIKAVISSFHTFITKWEEKLNLRILGGSKVPFEKYLKFRDEYIKRTEQLQALIESESATLTQLENVNSELLAEKQKHNEARLELAIAQLGLEQTWNISILDGLWKRTYKGDQKEFTDNIRIQRSNVYVQKGRFSEHEYNIHDFHFDPRSKRAYFQLSKLNGSDPHGFFSFTSLDFHHDQFSGVEHRRDGSFEVEYKRA